MSCSKPNASEIRNLFNETFGGEYNVALETGASEPFYRAARSPEEKNILHSREDFVRSTLHEIAHWCIAGEERRKKDDFGYWYSPDGRDLSGQEKFEACEVKPQAIEKAFCEALGIEFQVSVDNLKLEHYDTNRFSEMVQSQLNAFRRAGFPPRAARFIEAIT